MSRKAMMAWLALGVAALGFVVGVLLLVWRVIPAGDAAPPATAGGTGSLRFFRDPRPIPELTMRDLDGQLISSADWSGKVTLVNFWATWCGPCRVEIPDLIALQKKYGDHLRIIGISDDEGPPENVRSFAVAHRINYPIVMSTPELKRAFNGVRALPTTFVLDREGRLVQHHVGLLNAELTELETRALAGLPVNAAIEEVERGQPAHLENLAHATEIPGVDLSRLSPEKRMAALQKLNKEPCPCGCDNTVAKCRIDDPSCPVSLPLAKSMVEDIAGQH
jgi:thiol-disulfide isomerase/thioredoxin